MKKIALNLLKLAVSVGLLAYLVDRAVRDERFQQLAAGEKNWWALGAGLLVVLAAVTLTIARWYLLVRALKLECSLLEALKAGFVGYLFNLSPFGLAGADTVKAGFLIARNPQRKTESVATVLIDRVIGLYALLTLAAGASLFVDVNALPFQNPTDKNTVYALVQSVRWLAAIGSGCLAVMLVPGFTTWALWDLLAHLPLVGGLLQKLVAAMRQYRRSVGALLAAIGMSLVIHSLYAVMFFIAAIGLQSPGPPLGAHLVFVPVSMCAGVGPPGGLEFFFNLLYAVFSPAETPPSQGLLLAIAYRLFQVATAGIGVAFYFLGGKEVSELTAAAPALDEEASPLAQPASKAQG